MRWETERSPPSATADITPRTLTVTVDPTQANTNAPDLRVAVRDSSGTEQVRRWLIPLLPEAR